MALDFDKDHWQLDALAFSGTANCFTLQKLPREQGFSTFVDETLTAFTDQWASRLSTFLGIDENIPMMLRMFEKRMKGYRSMGYTLS